MQTCVVLRLEGRVSHERVLRHFWDRLHMVPRRRMVPIRVPFGLGRPVWSDAQDFDLTHHIRRVRLPAPGDENQLARAVAEAAMVQMDPGRPRWTMTLIEGLADGNTALVVANHHVLADGISNMTALRAESESRPGIVLLERPDWQPAPAPSRLRLVLDALRDAPRSLREMWIGLKPGGYTGRAPLRDRVRMSRWILRRSPRTPLAARVGTRRGWTFVRSSIADLDRIRRVFGGTLNDVALAVTAGALRAWMLGRGSSPEGLTLKAMCPVSDPERPDEVGNFAKDPIGATLPVHEPDCARRLQLVTDFTRRAKSVPALMVGGDLPALPARAFVWLVRALARARLVNVIVSNVPGPAQPLWVADARVLEILPVGFCMDHLAAFTSVQSYDGQLVIAFTVDADVVPDVTALAEGAEDALAELLARADAIEPAARPRELRAWSS
jgi:WS/DGAT/MGAT family acyltransferase